MVIWVTLPCFSHWELCFPPYEIDSERSRQRVFFGLCLLAAIEALQLFTSRSIDVNDVITNLAETMHGYFLVTKVPKDTPESDPPLSAADPTVLCLTSALVMFFVYPFITV